MRLVCLFAALALLVAACGDGGLKTVTITLIDEAGFGQDLTVELARTPEERGRGLMFREELPEERGMLFVYAADSGASFWMKDTPLPLSIAFIAADGTILDVQDMEPLSEERHASPEPYRYALEVNQGWFERNGLSAGGRVEIPASVADEIEG